MRRIQEKRPNKSPNYAVSGNHNRVKCEYNLQHDKWEKKLEVSLEKKMRDQRCY